MSSFELILFVYTFIPNRRWGQTRGRWSSLVEWIQLHQRTSIRYTGFAHKYTFFAYAHADWLVTRKVISLNCVLWYKKAEQTVAMVLFNVYLLLQTVVAVTLTLTVTAETTSLKFRRVRSKRDYVNHEQMDGHTNTNDNNNIDVIPANGRYDGTRKRGQAVGRFPASLCWMER